MSANFGYIRVSTKEQNIDRQKEELINGVQMNHDCLLIMLQGKMIV